MVMSDKIDLTKNRDLEYIANEVRQWLQKDNSWVKRFRDYADKICNMETTIKEIKKSFHKSPNLNLYTCISDIKNKRINIRYKGQSVGYIKKDDKLKLQVNKTQKKRFNLEEELNCDWDSPEATKFRKYFSQDIESKGQVEHRFESMLIEEFAKRNSKDKELCYIQPVRIYNELAFQMTTALKASDKEIRMATNARAGGIDILARVKHGTETNLCVIELKKDVLKDDKGADIVRAQGLAYAVFLRELLRSSCGEEWYKIFGYSGKIPEKLTINICIAMPEGEYKPKAEPKDIKIGNDILSFKSLFFETKETITSIKTNLFSKE